MVAPEVVQISQAAFLKLYKGNIIPLRVVVAGLTWVIHDYFATLKDEIQLIWSQERGLGKSMFLWVRYYTIVLVLFDTLQIHTFSIRGVATDRTCVIIAPITRILGAIVLWSIEIIMQIRVYALFNRSKTVAAVNGILFLASIGIYIWILVFNSMRRGVMIASAKRLPLPGCPAINGGTEWALWIPPTVFEFILFLFVFYKASTSIAARVRLNQRLTLTMVLLHENTLYFFSIACLLIFNNLMVVGATKIPWFGFAPFHAAMGIVTCRMLLHLRKFTERTMTGSNRSNPTQPMGSLHFASGNSEKTKQNGSKGYLFSTTSVTDSYPLKSMKSVLVDDAFSDQSATTEREVDPESQLHIVTQA